MVEASARNKSVNLAFGCLFMKIAVIAPESSSHVHLLSAVGRELKAQGHDVTYFGFLEFNHVPQKMGLNFAPILPEEYPKGKIQEMLDTLSGKTGIEGARKTVELLGVLAQLHLEQLPQMFREHGIEGLVADQISPAAKTIADICGIPSLPYVTRFI